MVMKFGCVVTKRGSFMFASWMRIISAVGPAEFSNVFRALLLLLILWDMTFMVAADFSCLCISDHSGVSVLVGKGWAGGSSLFP